MTLRAMDVVRLGLGAADLVATRRVAALELGVPAHEDELVILRILGLRQVAQALLSAVAGLRTVGAAADLLHAASAAGLALFGATRTRRIALIQAAVATLLAAAGLLASHAGR